MPDPRYRTWADDWLITHDMINCSECHAAQFMAHRSLAFVHKADCSREGAGQYPYLDLLAILTAMQDELSKQGE
jgi:hypothetical protein